MNGSDCGVFTCKFAEYITRDAKITFSQVNALCWNIIEDNTGRSYKTYDFIVSQENMAYFRRRMVYEIVTSKLL